MRDTTSLGNDNSFKSATTAIEAMAILAVLAQRLSIGTSGVRDMNIEIVAENNLSIFLGLMAATTNELDAWLSLENDIG